MGYITYRNQGATRSGLLDPDFEKRLGYLQDMGVTMEVFSGGQAAAGEGGPRTGSTRHDHGNAADVFFYKDGRKLDWNNPDDLPVFEQIVSQGKANGITGFGAGPGYMQEGSMHIGMGTPAVWGAGGKSANAPAWLRKAYGADPTDQMLASTAPTSTPALPAAPTADAKANPNAGKPYDDGVISWVQNHLNPDKAPKQEAAVGADGKPQARGLLQKLGFKGMPDKIMGIDLNGAGKSLSAIAELAQQQADQSNAAVQQQLAAGQARRGGSNLIQQEFTQSPPPGDPTGGQQADPAMDPVQMALLKKKIMMKRKGGLAGFGGFNA